MCLAQTGKKKEVGGERANEMRRVKRMEDEGGSLC
jgi:hypothetical protein